MKKIITALLTLNVIFGIQSCKKTDIISSSNVEKNVENMDEMIVPEFFNYSSMRDINVEIKLFAPDGNPISGIPVQINKIVNDSLKKVFTIVTNQEGIAQGIYSVPSYIKELVISTNYIGIPNDVIVPINGNSVSFVIDKNGIPNQNFVAFNNSKPGGTFHKRTILNYKYLAGYNSQGVPKNLEKRDVITSDMLDYINNSLPERKNVPQSHPSYLKDNLNTDIDIKEKADVWITFVHEGAGYTNSLCYYKYKTNAPPKTYSNIDTFFVVFPNASFVNSGGGMYSGDKVKIGTFDEGTSIGFACISNGWNGSNLGDGIFQLFSEKSLNNLSNSSLKQHTLMLYDEKNKLFYFGCEDIRRDNSSCDNDFNDMVFYAKSNPVKSISTEKVALADDGKDTDTDGVSDIYDFFPNDPKLAYRNFFPEEGKFGSLAFEDSWPGKGDYDFNDLVLTYQYEYWLGADNKVKEMKGRYLVNAIGAHYYHGFGIQMDIKGSEISSVKGSALFDGKISNQGNGIESSQNKATIIVFDNDYKLVKRAQGQDMNTNPEKPFQKPDTLTVSVSFNKTVLISELGNMPYNPFIFVNGDRGKEVHLPGYTPTSKANTSYFETYHDQTIPSKNKYYKTPNNLPFAIHIPEKIEYPFERKSLDKGYLKFIAWAQSGGLSYTDWYLNLVGYRDKSILYSK